MAKKQDTPKPDKSEPLNLEAAVHADRQRRANELGEIITRESERLKCDLVAVPEIVNGQIVAKPVIVPR